MSNVKYVDRVVEYHQFRNELGLSVADARSNPDTLEVFQELTETVADSPELVTAYTGVLRSRGARKKEAIEAVRSFESDILVELADAEAITEAKRAKEDATLQTDEGIVERAERFVKLFKQVIPKENLPKKRRAPRKPERAIESEEVQQDKVFRVEIDEDDTIIINGKTPRLNHPQHVLLHLLLAEPDTNVYLTRSYITSRPAWKALAARSEKDPKLLFTQTIGKLRKHLTSIGLERFIDTDGERGQKGYRADAHSVRFRQAARESVKPTTKPTATDKKVDRPEQAPPSERVLTPEAFALQILTAVQELEESYAERGLRLAKATRYIAQALDIERSDAREVIRQFEDSGQLFVGGAKKGHRHVSSEPIPEQSPSRAQQPEVEKRPQWTPEDEKAINIVIEKLLSQRNITQGRGIKKFWEQELQGIVDERRFKYLIRKLDDIGILEIRRDVNINRGGWRPPKVSVMRISSSDVRNLLKDDSESVINQLRSALDQ